MGDPGRVDMIADLLDEVEFRHASREFVSVTGQRMGKRITVLSHGIGPDNIDIVMTELDALANIDFATREVKPVHKALNILRIGTSGALHADIPLGSYILSHYSVGFDGVLNWYANRENVTIPEVEKAFKKHMNWEKTLQSPYFVKASDKIIDLMKDVTVPGVTNPSGSRPAARPVASRTSRWKAPRSPDCARSSGITPALCAAPSRTVISRVPIRTTSRSSAVWRRSPWRGWLRCSLHRIGYHRESEFSAAAEFAVHFQLGRAMKKSPCRSRDRRPDCPEARPASAVCSSGP